MEAMSRLTNNGRSSYKCFVMTSTNHTFVRQRITACLQERLAQCFSSMIPNSASPLPNSTRTDECEQRWSLISWRRILNGSSHYTAQGPRGPQVILKKTSRKRPRKTLPAPRHPTFPAPRKANDIAPPLGACPARLSHSLLVPEARSGSPLRGWEGASVTGSVLKRKQLKKTGWWGKKIKRRITRVGPWAFCIAAETSQRWRPVQRRSPGPHWGPSDLSRAERQGRKRKNEAIRCWRSVGNDEKRGGGGRKERNEWERKVNVGGRMLIQLESIVNVF